jgi:hypothetical protein
MPTGDVLRGTGTVVRWLPEGNGLSHGEGVIITMDDGKHVEPWSYRGRTCFVETDGCELLADDEPTSTRQA